MIKTRTKMAKASEVERKCYIVDAQDKILGRLAAKVATILRGKHKVSFTPHVDTGDMVIIINAEKIRVTGNKMVQKEYQRYSGYHSGQKRVKFNEMLSKKPTQILRTAITGMIPKGRLGNKVIKKLKIYAGNTHPHTAQKPIVLEV